MRVGCPHSLFFLMHIRNTACAESERRNKNVMRGSNGLSKESGGDSICVRLSSAAGLRG